MRVDWLGELRAALRTEPRRRTKRVRRQRRPAVRTASLELLEDRRLLAIDLGVPIFAASTTIGSGVGNGPAVADLSNFGTAIVPLGDLDGDGVVDMAVGAASDRTSGFSRGAVFVTLMNANGTVKSSQKIASSIGGGPTLANGDLFGTSLAAIGDLDGDGITELAVGASLDDTGGTNRGAVYVLFLKADGTAKSNVRIAGGVNGGPAIANYDYFGSSIAAIGDLDGDGVRDIVVGAKLDDTGGENRGALHVLLLNANGTVKGSSKITSDTNGTPTLHNDDRLGTAVAAVGDLDGDGVRDLAVSAQGNNGAVKNRGAVHVLFMHADGTVKASTTIASGVGGGPTLAANDQFGISLAAVGDLDGDGTGDLAVGANYDDTAGGERGAVYFVLLNSDGTAKSVQKMSSGSLGGPNLADSDYFGGSLALVGDLNGDGRPELAVGAPTDDSAGVNRGVVHLLLNRINRAPLITSTNTASVTENSTAVLTVTATDPDLPADVLTFAIAGGADQSRFTITAAGELSFVAAPDFDVPGDADGDNRYEVDVEVSDGHSGTATQTISVEVTPTNDNAPLFTSADSVSVAENSPLVHMVTATDADVPADSISFSIVGGVDQAHFAITPGGELSLVGALDFELPADSDADNRYVVVVEANDGHGGAATQTITVEVTPTNDHSPQFTSADAVSVAENSTAVLTVTATDADLPGDMIAYSIVGGADQLLFGVSVGGELSFVTAPDFESPTDAGGDNRYEVIVEASDGQGGTAMQTIVVEVTPVNDHWPIITSPDTVDVAENSVAVITVAATDGDFPADVLGFAIVGGADQALFAITSAGELSFIAPPDFEQPTDAGGDNEYEVSIEVSDGQGGLAQQTLRVFVTAIDDNPLAFTSPNVATVLENSVAVLTVAAADADLPLAAVSYSIVGGADQAQFSITAAGELTFLTGPDFELPTDADFDNRYEVVVAADDGQGNTVTQTITVEVSPANDHLPQFTSPDSASVAENEMAVHTVTASDGDVPSDTLTFSIVGGADQALFAIAATGELSFAVPPDFELPADVNGDNSYEVVVEVADGHGGTATQILNIMVTPLNDHQPVFTSADAASVPENSTAVHTVSATDADLPGDVVALSIVGGADQAHFAVTAGGELSFVTVPDFEVPTDADSDNRYEVVVEASDGNGGATLQTIVVEVTPVDEEPSVLAGAGAASFTGAVDQALSEWPAGRSAASAPVQSSGISTAASREELLMAALRSAARGDAVAATSSESMNHDASAASESDDAFAELESLLLSPAV